jgi:hypothetical protein
MVTCCPVAPTSGVVGEGYANRADTCNSAHNVIQQVVPIADEENAKSTEAANKNISRHAIIVGSVSLYVNRLKVIE